MTQNNPPTPEQIEAGYSALCKRKPLQSTDCEREAVEAIYLAMIEQTPDVDPIADDIEAKVDAALVSAEVKEPQSFMPNYWPVRVTNPSPAVADYLTKNGLCILPVCEGARSGFPIYSGEITGSGRERRNNAVARAALGTPNGK